MTRRLSVALILLVVLLLPAASPGHAQPRDEDGPARQAAREAAQEWLRHVDAGAWTSAWEASAPAIRDSVTEEQWAEQGSRMRETVGTLRSRRLARAQRRDTLQHPAGAGPFFLLQYHSTFEDGLYVETLLLTKEGDTWSVSGYEVAPVAAPAHRHRQSSRKENSSGGRPAAGRSGEPYERDDDERCTCLATLVEPQRKQRRRSRGETSS